MMIEFKTDSMKIPAHAWVHDISQIEQSALDQIEAACSLSYMKRVSIMPDVHAGFGAPIGFVGATEDVLIPSLVGVDIGCGMCAVKTPIKRDHVSDETIMSWLRSIKDQIPSGMTSRAESVYKAANLTQDTLRGFEEFIESFPRPWQYNIPKESKRRVHEKIDNAHVHVGTLGGGNHFIEFQTDTDDNLWVMLHSGSRGPGFAIANHFIDTAAELCSRWRSDTIKQLEFLPIYSQEGKDYLSAVKWAQEFALWNRRIMMEVILNTIADWDTYSDMINIHHNYVSLENHFGKNLYVHRKGATRVRHNVTGIIPGSMGTKSYIVTGKDNDKSMHSCSHGAGRAMGRKEAKRILSMDDFKRSTNGIVSLDICEDTLDEAPAAYKSIDLVMQNQADLVNIEVELTPIANIKAADKPNHGRGVE
jgi:tRNA-splicing ligase RtcB